MFPSELIFKEKIIMTIESKKDAGQFTITITGRLDTSTAPNLEEELKTSYDGITELFLTSQSSNTFPPQDFVFFSLHRKP